MLLFLLLLVGDLLMKLLLHLVLLLELDLLLLLEGHDRVVVDLELLEVLLDLLLLGFELLAFAFKVSDPGVEVFHLFVDSLFVSDDVGLPLG